jgi:hypothetical protein
MLGEFMMKKHFSRLLALCLAGALVFSLVSCGGDDKDAATNSNSSTTVSQSSEEENSTSTPAEENESSTGGDAAQQLADYIASDEVQQEIASLKESGTAQGLSNVEILSEGTKLVYVYTYAEGTATDGLAEALQAAIEPNASTFENVASTLSTALGDDISVEVRYNAFDGTSIYSQTFEKP